MSRILNAAKVTSAAAAAEPKRITVDDVPAKALVVRDGFQVPAVNLDPQLADFHIKDLIPVTPKFQPRVVSQSIPPGTRVIQGTVVDLILAPKDSLNFGILANPHADLKNRTFDQVDDLVENVKTRELLLKYESSGAVVTAEKAFLLSEFQKKGITVNDDDPERTFERAFQSIRSAVAFR